MFCAQTAVQPPRERLASARLLKIAFEQLLELFTGYRFAVEIPLPFVAVLGLQKIALYGVVSENGK